MPKATTKDMLIDTPVSSGGVTHVSSEVLAKVRNRLARAQGQLNGVIRMIDEGENCQAILTQMLAVSKAVDRASFSLLLSGLQACTADGSDDDRAKLEKLFMSLA